jgi:calcineurin-like phosphoesterase family protein
MNIFIISDTHFGHTALHERYKVRPADYEEKIVLYWKKIIQPQDLVIHLGDLFVGNPESWVAWLPELPGRKILVLGNHDSKSIVWYMSNGFDFCCKEFTWKRHGLRILFSHIPKSEGDFDINIHGHLHEGRHRECNTDDRHVLVSLEHTLYQPLKLDKMIDSWIRAKDELNQTNL